MSNDVNLPMTPQIALTILSVIKQVKETRGRVLAHDGKYHHGVSEVTTLDAELAELIGVQFTLSALLEKAKRDNAQESQIMNAAERIGVGQ